ncbi:hypothetical protein [Endozoicomonas sp. 8E]|uniref:hypothetical protein n=1 Tax=Endozoicomonas sp. 8E TaxID=3035692 RepID=UPI002938FB25|nr:hypothetical protein [Endozoicomonas sp. 8E]WOG26351.1 hypothetical protein P6910_17505 [Endozoicomonas sp. 8E]
MFQTYKATVDSKGNLKLPDNLVLPSGSNVLITILEESPGQRVNDEVLLSEPSLAADWNKPDEDEAWECLQQEQ